MNFSVSNAFFLTLCLTGLCVAMMAWVLRAPPAHSHARQFPLGRFFVGFIVVSIGSACLMPIEYTFLAGALGVLGGLTICRPAVGVATMLFFWITRPWELGFDVSLLPKLPRLWVVLIAIGLLHEKASAKGLWIQFSGHIKLWLVFMAWLGFTTVFAQDKAEAMRVFTEELIPIAVFLVLFAQVAKDYQAVLVAMIVSCISVGVVSFGRNFIKNGLHGLMMQRFTGIGMWANSNDVACVLIIGASLIISSKSSGGIFLTLMKVFFAAMMIGLVVMTQSRAALIALAFGFSTSLLRVKLTVPRVIMIGVFGIGLLLASTLFTRSESDLEGSSSARLNYVVTGFKMLESSPITGIGLGNYPIRFEQFTTDFSEYGQRTAHSSWVLVMAEAGIVGLALFFRMYWLAMKEAWKNRKRHPEILVSLSAYTVMMSTLSHTYLILPYVLFALSSFALPQESVVVQQKTAEKAIKIQKAFD